MLSSAPYQFGPIWARVHILLRAGLGEGERVVFSMIFQFSADFRIDFLVLHLVFFHSFSLSHF